MHVEHITVLRCRRCACTVHVERVTVSEVQAVCVRAYVEHITVLRCRRCACVHTWSM